MRLPYTELFATYQVVTPFRLAAHPGSMWRGVIGRLLRREGCARPRVCQESCQSPAECLYRKLFDPPVPVPPPHHFLRGEREAPPPLLPLFGWNGSEQLKVGDSLRIGLRCLGALPSVHQAALRNVLAALPTARLGRDAGQVALVLVSEPQQDERSASVRDCLKQPQDSFSVRMQLVTPLWIEQQGRLLQQLDFPRVFTDMMRRLTKLCALYGTHDPDDDIHFSALRTLASQVRVLTSRLTPLHWERHSRESDTRHLLHGHLGELTLHGPLAPFLPLLRLGELAHLGKATSFGLGRMQVHVLSEPPVAGVAEPAPP